MRVFTCLSQNVSMVMDREKKRSGLSRRVRLNFKSKKRRLMSPKSAVTGKATPKSRGVVTPRSAARTLVKNVAFRDENTPPASGMAQTPILSKAAIPRRINKPLPPIPDQGGVSIYIKELDAEEDDTDFLPLSHMEPPLMEEADSVDSSNAVEVALKSATKSSGTETAKFTEVGLWTRNFHENMGGDEDKIKSVKSLNEAFIQSAASLQARQALSNGRLDVPTSHLDKSVDITYSRRRQLRSRSWKQRTGHAADNSQGISVPQGANDSPDSSKMLHNLIYKGASTKLNIDGNNRNFQYELQYGNSFHSLDSQLDFDSSQSTAQLSPVYSQIEGCSQEDSQWTTTLDDDVTSDSQRLYENVDRLGRPRCEGQSQTTLNQTPTCDSIDYDEESQYSDYSQVDYTPSPTVPSSEGDTQYMEMNATAAISRSETNDKGYSRMERSSYQNPLPPQPCPDSPYYVNADGSSNCRASEFLGCMSFGIPHLLNKDLNGWYYLLTEEVGRKKHLKAHSKSKPVLTAKGHSNIPLINKSVEGQERIVITVPRGKNGFGFSFVSELPPKVGRVDRASPAEQAGVKKGDAVIRINGQNVSRSTCESVAHLVKKTNPQFLALELLRDHVVVTDVPQSAQASSNMKRGVGTSTDHVYESIMEDSRGSDEHHKENHRWAEAHGIPLQDEEYLTDDEQIISHGGLGNHGNKPSTITSTPMPAMVTAVLPSSARRKRHESIHCLMSLEFDYIDFMRFGAERYSRPLRHCVISASEHSVLFQNVEKLVTISEYHIKQLQDSNSSVNSDTDDSQSSETSIFPNSVALIYQSKIHMLCQAYQSYAHGLVHSNTLLRDLRRSKDFMKFIRDQPAEPGHSFHQPSISAFINRPVQHIHELYAVLRDIFSATPLHSPDYAVLQQVVCKLAQCISSITNLSSDGRVHSLDSLTSSQGCSTSQTTSSDKGSMASLTSCSSAEADALCPLVPPSTSTRSFDPEVAKIQSRLLFPPDVPTFQLCQEDRHIIFQGEIFRLHQGSWFKSQLLLLSDLILLLDMEPNGKLRVVETPVYLSDLAGIEINRKHASEFILHLHATPVYSAIPRSSKGLSSNVSSTKPLVLRAPSLEEKFVWKSLVEQRVTTVSGNKLQHYGSMRDISNIKTSAVL